ncbi:hypothetical protein V9T40_013676 [Parthenolecanium corni]|uniref:Guanylate kinase-like domain-containing protein n=1 Tax=Parthenolecanium corni TaxID=536013 RepID=A0AAN9TBF5_9HEMI
MVNSGQKRPSSKSCDEINITHWYQTVKKIVFQTFRNNNPCIVLSGGSDHGKLIYILEVSPEVKYSSDQICENNDVVLKIQEQKISGFTYLDAVNFLQYCFKNSNSVTIECVPSGQIPLNLAEFLGYKFQKGSINHDLQNTIRDNLYIRTVPVTTRPSRPSEVNGIDYVFLTVEEFDRLKLGGALLESGVYEGCSLSRQEVQYPYDVTVTRCENEGFGFVIISSLNKAGSAIGFP